MIATGSTAAMPPIPGRAEAQPWCNREATTSRIVPRRLLVLGGGVVGEVPIDRLWHCVPAFPTRSEVWLRLLEAYEAG